MKPITPAAWRQILRPGMRLFIASGAGCPHALIRSLLEQSHLLQDIEIIHLLTLGPTPWADPALADRVTVNSLFLGPGIRDAVNEARADYTPAHLSEIPRLIQEGLLPIDLALITISPPDSRGRYSLGLSVDITRAACLQARTVIAQINAHMPATRGRSLLPRRRIDWFLAADEPLPELPASAPTPIIQRIAHYASLLIPDGATLQTGVGSIPSAVLDALHTPRDLGLHSEMIGDAAMRAIQRGLITNRRKPCHPGVSIASFALGTRTLYEFIRHHPSIEFHPAEETNHPLLIARHDRMVSINSALQVDLTGQVAADSIGTTFYSGVGGQADFIRGAALARYGIPIIVLPSTATTPHGTVSRIVARLDPGAGVVTTRADVHFITTEFGTATLRGRSIRERALELIQIAHPAFRAQLLQEAIRLHLVAPYQTLPPTLLHPVHGIEARRVQLRDGSSCLLRPLHPSDERRLQEFFYSHTPQTIYLRYGHAIGQMSRHRAYELVSVDQSRHVALALLETQGPRQIIHAVGRYFLDPDGTGAEIAFIVRENRQRTGMASLLVKELIAIARARGLRRLWASVLRENIAAAALLRKLRFRPVAFSADTRIFELLLKTENRN